MLKDYLKFLEIEEATIDTILKILKEVGKDEQEEIKIIEKKIKILDWIGVPNNKLSNILENNIEFFTIDIETILSKIGCLYILGYHPEDVVRLIETDSTILNNKEFNQNLLFVKKNEQKKYTYDDFAKVGFNKNQYNKIKAQSKNIYDIATIDVYLRVGYLYTLGYMPWEVVKMITSCSRVITSPSVTITKKYNALKDMGFSEKSVHKMTVAHAKVYSYNSMSIKKRIDDLINIGLSKEDAIRVIEIYPQILSLTWEHCLERKRLFEESVFTEEETLMIIMKYPTIFGWSIEKCTEKLNFIENRS